MEKISEEVALLVAQSGPLNGGRWPLHKTVLVGREPTCDIVIADRQVSRHHARFIVTRNGILLEDLNSKNGTHHNGQAVIGSILLQDGDVIQVALAQKFLFLSSDATVPLEYQEAASQLSTEQLEVVQPLGKLRLEKRSRRVWIAVDDNDVEILPPLSVSQFRLLEMLYENPGRVISRIDLVGAIWGEEQAFDVSEQALDALVRRLRDRIAGVDPDHGYIVTVRGHGLRLDNPPL
jgi:hypothetical protein